MKLRLHARSFDHLPQKIRSESLGAQLDRAIAPIGTACLVWGLVAAFLPVEMSANFLIATGLLFHLVNWFGGWLEKG